MIKLTVSEVLNDTGAMVARVAAPWVAVVWLCSLPLRLLQAYFFQQLLQLNDQAKHYGDHLFGIAAYTTAAFVLSIYGRALFVRACNLSRTSTLAPGAEVLRLPPASFANYLYAALVFEAAFYMLGVIFLPIPVIVALSGLAAAVTHGQATPGLLAPILATLSAFVGSAGSTEKGGTKPRATGPVYSGMATMGGLLLTFGIALLIVWINLYFAFLAGLWLMGGIGGLDLSRWAYVMRPVEGLPLFPVEPVPLTLLFAGAVVALEPYWLAAHVVYVKSLRARESGEDLKQWFDEIKQEAP